MNTFLDALEARNPQSREQALMTRLPQLIAQAQSASGWAIILQGVNPADIKSRHALAQIPVTRKSDLKNLQKQSLPFGGLNTTSTNQLQRIFMSPGPIYDPQGRGQDWWRFARALHAAGIRPGHLLQNCYTYHFTPAAFMVESAALKLGCVVIPAGSGQTELQVQAMAELRPDAYIGAPSFLKIIIEKALDLGADISSVKRAVVGAEMLPPSLRKWLQEHGVKHVLQSYASADIGNIAYETETDGMVNPGMVLDEDLLLEIVRPGTGDVVEEGEIGEVVITSFNPDYPLIRFGTGDMSAVLPGISPCGRTNIRIQGWLGRADQTTKVKGMFVHPSQIADVLRRHPEISKARMVVTGEMANDVMSLHCETKTPSETLRQAMVINIREITKLRGDVQFVAIGSLPNDGKVIDDARSYQ